MTLHLGLDISTSNIGWCIIDSTSKKVIAAEAIELKKEKSVFCKANRARLDLTKIKDAYDISTIAIEENLQAFRPGFSSASTIVSLARFNGMVSLIANDVFLKEPIFLNVNNARKIAGFKKEKKATKSTKDQVFDFVKVKLPDFEWPTKTLKSGPRKGCVIFAEHCYDIADSYIIALASTIHE